MKNRWFQRMTALVLALLVLLLTTVSGAGQSEPTDSSCDPALQAGCAGEAVGSAAVGDIYLPLVTAPPVHIPVAGVLKPFDGNMSDLGGPSSWGGNYGKLPEIIVASNGMELDVLAQDYDPATPWKAVLLHIQPNASGSRYFVTQALTQLPMLDRVMGLAVDAAGNRYYATAVNESALISPTYPPANTYRSNIVGVFKLDPHGTVLFGVDLDPARHAFNQHAEMIINPGTFSSARLAVGGNEVALVHGINTGPDWGIQGARHQKALSTRLDATTGAVTQTSSVWVSHSFDQRLMYDGQGIIEHHLGDAYPRYLVFGRNNGTYPLFHIKGPVGENLTTTRLGNLALIENDPVYGYLALFAAENTPTLDSSSRINGPRNLAIVRVNRDDNSLDPSLPHTLTVDSAGEQRTNRLRWLTGYTAASRLHAERPKLIGIGGDQYIVLWEQWLNQSSYMDTFQGVYAMLIDDAGNPLLQARLITAGHHLPRGDDAFYLNYSAAWMTGDTAASSLTIHFVDAALNYRSVTLE